MLAEPFCWPRELWIRRQRTLSSTPFRAQAAIRKLGLAASCGSRCRCGWKEAVPNGSVPERRLWRRSSQKGLAASNRPAQARPGAVPYPRHGCIRAKMRHYCRTHPARSGSGSHQAVRAGATARNLERLALRSDLHRLFDDGYLRIDPVDRRVVVSKRIKRNLRTAGSTTGSKAKPSASQATFGQGRTLPIWSITHTTSSGKPKR